MKSALEPADSPAPPDVLNSIGVLKRREIEARIVKPLLDAFAAEFGRDRVFSIAQDVIIRIAREQGKALADQVGGCSLTHFAGAQGDWKTEDAYQTQVLEQSDTTFAFNVTRCRYAEMYQSLGIPELGRLLSCNRDFSLIEGFNPTIKLTRTQTIMEGAHHCDFRFIQQEPGKRVSPATRAGRQRRRASGKRIRRPRD